MMTEPYITTRRYYIQVRCDLDELDLLSDLAESFGSFDEQRIVDYDYIPDSVDVRHVAHFHSFSVAAMYQQVSSRFNTSIKRQTCFCTSGFPVTEEPENLVNGDCVYILKYVGSKDIYKIGKTNNIRKRIKALSTASPYPIEVEHLIATESPQDSSLLEIELHDVFCHRRMNGEWFNLTEEDLDFVKKNCKQSQSKGCNI